MQPQRPNRPPMPPPAGYTSGGSFENSGNRPVMRPGSGRPAGTPMTPGQYARPPPMQAVANNMLNLNNMQGGVSSVQGGGVNSVPNMMQGSMNRQGSMNSLPNAGNVGNGYGNVAGNRMSQGSMVNPNVGNVGNVVGNRMSQGSMMSPNAANVPGNRMSGTYSPSVMQPLPPPVPGVPTYAVPPSMPRPMMPVHGVMTEGQSNAASPVVPEMNIESARQTPFQAPSPMTAGKRRVLQAGYTTPEGQSRAESPMVGSGYQPMQSSGLRPMASPVVKNDVVGQMAGQFGQMGIQSMPNVNFNGQAEVYDLQERLVVPSVPHINVNFGIPPPVECGREYMRPTLNKFPTSQSLLSKSRLIAGVCVNPFPSRRGEIPVVSGVIVRCRRCRTYINPYVTFMDQGTRWKCNLCEMVNDMPGNYDYDSLTQGYVNRSERRELFHSVVEFVAPTEYMTRPPQPLAIIFLIDVSFPSLQGGVLKVVAGSIKETIEKIPNENGRLRVGIMTFDDCIHYYNLNSNLMDVEMFVVSDLEETFIPIPDDLLVNLSESEKIIESLLEKIERLFKGKNSGGNVLGPALKSAVSLLSPIGGKIVVVQSGLPNKGEGVLKNREDVKLMGTNKESTLFQPSSNFYKNLAIECSKSHISVDMFVVSNQYNDLATLNGLVTFTGGNLYYYPTFNGGNLEEIKHLSFDFSSSISRYIGLEAVFRVRASKGITSIGYFGNHFMRSSDLISLPTVSPDNCQCVQFSLEETITTPYISIQTALLYTTIEGERRIRVFTLCLPTTSNLNELYSNVDEQSMFTLLSKMAIERILTHKLEDSREGLINKSIELFSSFQNGKPNMTLPLNLKHFPLLILSLLKSIPFRFGNGVIIPSDLRVFLTSILKNLYIDQSILFIHPDLYPLHLLSENAGLELSDGSIQLPQRINLSSEHLEQHGLFLLNNGLELFLFIGRLVSPDLCLNVFDRPSFETIQSGKSFLPELKNPLSIRIAKIIKQLKANSNTFLPLIIVKDDGQDKNRFKFFSHLIEDRGTDGSHSYSQWIAYLRDKLISK